MSKIPEHAQKVFSWVIFDVYQWDQELYDGTTTTFEVVKRPGTGLVIPVLDNGNILLATQEQPCDKEASIDFLWGRQDEGEDLLETTRRELLEESWYSAESFDLLISKRPWGWKVEWEIHYYVAKWLKKVVEPKLDGGEKIELLEISLDDFLQMKFPEDVHVSSDVLQTIQQIQDTPELLSKLT